MASLKELFIKYKEANRKVDSNSLKDENFRQDCENASNCEFELLAHPDYSACVRCWLVRVGWGKTNLEKEIEIDHMIDCVDAKLKEMAKACRLACYCTNHEAEKLCYDLYKKFSNEIENGAFKVLKCLATDFRIIQEEADMLDAFQKEDAAFRKMLPELLKSHKGKFVAVYEGKVVAFGDDDFDVAKQLEKDKGKYGCRFVLIRRIIEYNIDDECLIVS
jgi:hypothetical protein